MSSINSTDSSSSSSDEFTSQLKYHEMVSSLSSLSVTAVPFVYNQTAEYPRVPPPSPMTPLTPITPTEGERPHIQSTKCRRTQFDYEFALETIQKRGPNPIAKDATSQSTDSSDDSISCSQSNDSPSDSSSPPSHSSHSSQSSPALEHESLLMLIDWDDTLYPTTFMNEILVQRDSNSLALVRDDQIENLQRLGALTLSLMRSLIAKYGAQNLHIVTNSVDGWIAESLSYAACIAPVYRELGALLDLYRIKRVSARSAHQSDKSLTPTQWKERVYAQLISDAQPQTEEYAHILTIGDQWTDHYAAKNVVASLKTYSATPIHHAVKLKMSPTIHDLVSEMMYVEACFAQIFDVFTWTQSQYFAHPHSVQPVIIDYEVEEQKQVKAVKQQQMEQLRAMQAQYQRPIAPVNMANMNVNVNVNLIGM